MHSNFDFIVLEQLSSYRQIGMLHVYFVVPTNNHFWLINVKANKVADIAVKWTINSWIPRPHRLNLETPNYIILLCPDH